MSAKPKSVPTRVAADLAAAASSVAPSEHRTFAEQVNFWARIGMEVERSGSLVNRQVLAVAAGEEQFSSLTGAERRAAHALIDARIAERTARERFGDAPTSGQSIATAVAVDDDGNLVELSAEATTTRR